MFNIRIIPLLLFCAGCTSSSDNKFKYEFSSEVVSEIRKEMRLGQFYYDTVCTWLYVDTIQENGFLRITIRTSNKCDYCRYVKSPNKYTLVDSLRVPIITSQEDKIAIEGPVIHYYDTTGVLFSWMEIRTGGVGVSIIVDKNGSILEITQDD